MKDQLSDAEIIAQWMEPKPQDGGGYGSDGHEVKSPLQWWRSRWSVVNQVYRWWPNSDRCESLDALWEVEERLTDEQTALYCTALDRETRSPEGVGIGWRFVHATPEQKIKALAAVLRPIVEAGGTQ